MLRQATAGLKGYCPVCLLPCAAYVHGTSHHKAAVPASYQDQTSSQCCQHCCVKHTAAMHSSAGQDYTVLQQGTEASVPKAGQSSGTRSSWKGAAATASSPAYAAELLQAAAQWCADEAGDAAAVNYSSPAEQQLKPGQQQDLPVQQQQQQQKEPNQQQQQHEWELGRQKQHEKQGQQQQHCQQEEQQHRQLQQQQQEQHCEARSSDGGLAVASAEQSEAWVRFTPSCTSQCLPNQLLQNQPVSTLLAQACYAYNPAVVTRKRGALQACVAHG